MASGGYPGDYATGLPIRGVEDVDGDVEVFFAGAQRTPEGALVTSGGRVLCVVAKAPSLAEARARALRQRRAHCLRGRALPHRHRRASGRRGRAGVIPATMQLGVQSRVWPAGAAAMSLTGQPPEGPAGKPVRAKLSCPMPECRRPVESAFFSTTAMRTSEPCIHFVAYWRSPEGHGRGRRREPRRRA